MGGGHVGLGVPEQKPSEQIRGREELKITVAANSVHKLTTGLSWGACQYPDAQTFPYFSPPPSLTPALLKNTKE